MQKIIILDFGGQYTHLIANRIRRLGVYTEIHENDSDLKGIKDLQGIILSGGPMSVYEKKSPQLNKAIFELGVPILGLCYGHQLIAQNYEGKVKPGKTKEYGIAKLEFIDSLIFKNLEQGEQVWMSHGDSVSDLPPGFEKIGTTSDCPIAAMQNTEKQLYGFQFHPEVTHTKHGMKILSNFIFEICKCEKNWSAKNYTQHIKNEIKEKVKDNNVFMLVSGGVDSTVAFTLLNKTLNQEKIYGLFINNGLIRKGEFEYVDQAIKSLGYNNFHSYDATDLFLDRLKNVYEPEEKRKIIGDTFIDVQKKALQDLNLDDKHWLLGQGTIYPDTIESKGTKNSDLIKTHHNRVPIIQKLIEEGKVIEPLDNLYKDEVREVGEELGLPKNLVWRHPFPGPGLGVRCLCNDSLEQIENEKEINERINNITSKYNLKGKIIPMKSVGVQGDARTYRHPAVIIGNSDWDTLEKLSTEITNNVKEVNRCILLISHNDLENIQPQKKFITKERLDILREADDIAMNTIEKHNLMDTIWQMPTVIAPIGKDDKESIILRPVFSTEAMTAEFAKIDISVAKEISDKILNIPEISHVYYDITNKPPGTIEWE